MELEISLLPRAPAAAGSAGEVGYEDARGPRLRRRASDGARAVPRLVEAGQAVCVRCGELIAPGTPFDLDHNASRTGHLGVSHRTCNRRAGGKNGAAVTNARRWGSEPRYVRSWSRVWSWPIPPDTYVDPEVVREYVEEEARRGEG